jgi:hypothetical protein
MGEIITEGDDALSGLDLRKSEVARGLVQNKRRNWEVQYDRIRHEMHASAVRA